MRTVRVWGFFLFPCDCIHNPESFESKALTMSNSECHQNDIDASRYFPNPYMLQTGDGDEHDRHRPLDPFSAKTLERNFEMAMQLTQWCQEGHVHCHPHSLGNLYHGPLGPLVYLDWKLMLATRKRKRENGPGQGYEEHMHHTQLEKVLLLAQKAALHHESHFNRRHVRVTLLEGPYVGAKAMEAVLLYSLNRPDAARQSAEYLISWLHSMTSQTALDQRRFHKNRREEQRGGLSHDLEAAPLSPSACEILYGRAGAIQTILFLRAELNDPQLGSDVVLELAETIVEQGIAMAKHYSQYGLPLLWHWRDKFFLGAAHGVVGILQTLLSLNPKELQQLDQSYSLLSLVRQTIDRLNTKFLHPSGNLESSIPEPNNYPATDRLVHWCHGAVGHVLLLLQAARIFQNDQATCVKYRDMACEIANNVIWPRGLLRKGVGLCHGISGNAYTLLALSELDDSFRTKAQCFVDFAVQHRAKLEYIPDRPYSLFEGMGGLCLLLLDMAEDPSNKKTHAIYFPLYSFV